jgi:hypothetical protein
MEYMILFYQDYELEEKTYKAGDAIRVNQEKMFFWVQKAHVEKLKISIYSCRMVCDLSY